MNLISPWMQSDWMIALGWTFVHSLWQIALIGLLLYVILRQIPGQKAHIRYMVSTMALWSIVVMALSTFLVMLPDPVAVTEITGTFVFLHEVSPANTSSAISAWIESQMPMLLTIWFGGVAILLLHLLVSLGWVRHIRKTAKEENEIQAVLDQLIHRLKLKIFPKATSTDLVSSPVTIGHLKPVILFPAAIINQLTPAEVEAILAHELAHIVRKDYLSNLVQSFIETLFYYHPVTWWISSMVRAERENRADDLAVSWCGDHLGYAKALLTIQEMETSMNSSLAIGFASKKRVMLTRIQRILNLPYKNHNQMEKTVLLSLCSLCFLAFTLTSHTTTDNAEESVSPKHAFFAGFEEKTDSIPAKGTYHIHKKTNEKEIRVEVEDGNIKELIIDGKPIGRADYGAYHDVVGELFGGMQAPPAVDGKGMPAPPRPPMPPDIHEFEFDFEMPPMPPIPAMPELKFEHFFNGEHFNWSGDGEGSFKIITKDLGDGDSKIIIITDGDSSIIRAPHMFWSQGDGNSFEHRDFMLKEDEWKKHMDAWKEQSQMWKEQWRDQQNEYRHEWRDKADQYRSDMELKREMEREHNLHREDALRQKEDLLSRYEKEGLLRRYEYAAPRLSLSDEMVKDGLVKRGEEVDVLLTPDKLKINGKKMPDSVHEKYLRMYERAQGIELTGNSRVQFTTKSKQRM